MQTKVVDIWFNSLKYTIMATLTNEQIEQKKQLLAEKMKEAKAIYDELVEAGAIELSDEDLDGASGGAMSFIHEQFHML